MKYLQSVLLSIIAIGMLFASAAKTNAFTVPTKVQQVGNITYTTGISDEEVAELRKYNNDYNLRITNTSTDGDLERDAQIIISSPQGEVLLNADAGAIFCAHLPLGNYIVEEENYDRSIIKHITVGAHNKIHYLFSWNETE